MESTDNRPVTRVSLVAAFAAVYLIWGSTYLAIRVGIETVPPFLMAGARFLAAGLPFYLLLRLRGAAAPTARHWLSAGVLGTLMLACGNGLVTWAETRVPSSVAALIIATVPLWMTLLAAWPFRRAGITRAVVIGLILGLTGIAVLVAPTGAEFDRSNALAILVLVGAALAWSVGSLLSRSIALPRSAMLVASMQMTAGGLMLLVWSFLAGEWPSFDPGAVSLRSMLALAYLVSFGSIVALAAYVFLMQRVSATAVSSYAFVNPLVAVILGWALAGERFGSREATASALVIGAVVFLQGSRWLATRRRHPPLAARPTQVPVRPPCPAAGPEKTEGSIAV